MAHMPSGPAGTSSASAKAASTAVTADAAALPGGESDLATGAPAPKDTAQADKAVLDTMNAEARKNADAFEDAIDAKMRKAGLDPDEGDETQPRIKAPKRGAGGKFVKADADADADADGAEGTDAPAACAAPSPEDIQKAAAAAARDGARKSVLKAIAEGDADEIAHYLKRAKVQSDGDEFTTNHRKLQQEFEALKAGKPAANSGGEIKANQAATAAPAQDLEAAVAPLAKYFEESLLDMGEASKPILESFTALQSLQNAAIEQRDQQIAALTKRLDGVEMQNARDALISQFPDLKDRALWSKVKAGLDAVPASAAYPDLESRLEAAARIELAPILAERARTNRKLRDAGAPDVPSNTGDKRPGTMNVRELQDALLDAKMGDDEERFEAISAELKRRQ